MSSDLPDDTKHLIRARAHGRCELCRHPDAALDVHHRQRRGMGGTSSLDIHLPSNLIAVCRRCHDWIHQHPSWAIDAGFIVPATSVPWRTLVWIWHVNYAAPAWYHLDDDALLTWIGSEHPPPHLPSPWAPTLAQAAA